MSSAFMRRIGATVGLAAFVAIAFAATRPPVKGVTYRLRMTTRLPQMLAQMGGPDGAGGPVILAKVTAAGKRAKFEFLSGPPGAGLDDYALIDSAHAYIVNPVEKTYTDGSGFMSGGGGLGMLSQFAGRAGRGGGGGGRGGRGGGGGGDGAGGGGGGAPPIDIAGLVTDLEQLDGDTLGGRQVRRYQLVAEMSIMAMGQQVPLRIVIESWNADLPFTIINPFDLTGTASPDDPAGKLTLKLLELRKQMQGTPLKMIMTTTISGLGGGAVPPFEFVQTTAITDIKEMDVDDKVLALPAGFTKKGG